MKAIPGNEFSAEVMYSTLQFSIVCNGSNPLLTVTPRKVVSAQFGGLKITRYGSQAEASAGALLGTTGRHPLEILGDPSIITVTYYLLFCSSRSSVCSAGAVLFTRSIPRRSLL